MVHYAAVFSSTYLCHAYITLFKRKGIPSVIDEVTVCLKGPLAAEGYNLAIKIHKTFYRFDSISLDQVG